MLSFDWCVDSRWDQWWEVGWYSSNRALPKHCGCLLLCNNLSKLRSLDPLNPLLLPNDIEEWWSLGISMLKNRAVTRSLVSLNRLGYLTHNTSTWPLTPLISLRHDLLEASTRLVRDDKGRLFQWIELATDWEWSSSTPLPSSELWISMRSLPWRVSHPVRIHDADSEVRSSEFKIASLGRLEVNGSLVSESHLVHEMLPDPTELNWGLPVRRFVNTLKLLILKHHISFSYLQEVIGVLLLKRAGSVGRRLLWTVGHH